MAKPWEKFKNENAAKPWEKFAKPKEAPAEETVSAPEDYAGDSKAALQGFGQGASLGYLPQIQAAAEPAITKIGDLITGQDQYSELPPYVERRDKNIELLEKLQKSNPKSMLAGQVAGTLSSLVAPGAALSKVAPIAAGATGADIVGALTTRGLANAAAGIGTRMVANPGDVKGVVDPLQSQPRAQTIADNPGALALDLAVPFAGQALSSAGTAVRNKAGELAFKALGPYAKQARNAMASGKVQDVGKTMLDTGAVGGIPTSYQGLADRLGSLRQSSGKELGDTVAKMAQAESGVPISLSRGEMAEQLEKKLINTQATDAADVLDQNARMQSRIDAVRTNNGAESSTIPLLEAEMKKRAVQKTINYNRPYGSDIPEAEIFNREYANQLRKGVEKGGEELAVKTGFDVNKFKELKNTSGNIISADEIVNNRNGREFANRFLSPSDYGVGAMGAAVGGMSSGSPEERMKHAALGASLALLNKGARQYGNQYVSGRLNLAGHLLKGTGSAIDQATQNPMIVPALQQNAWNMLYNQKKDGK